MYTQIAESKKIWLFLALFLCLSWSLAGKCVGDEAYLWQSLKSENTFALLRHALAPGTGDPADFSLRDCTTQRLLSQKGRDQAKIIGSRFRENGIHSAEVYSSQWCRCLETANLLNLGRVHELEILNSFFRHFEKREKQTSAFRKWLQNRTINGPLILVTHQVNITAFTDIFPRSGEMVVVLKADKNTFSVLGTIQFE